MPNQTTQPVADANLVVDQLLNQIAALHRDNAILRAQNLTLQQQITQAQQGGESNDGDAEPAD